MFVILQICDSVKEHHKFIVTIFSLIHKQETGMHLIKYSSSRHIKLLLLILIHLVGIWYEDKNLYKVVISTIQTPAHDLKVKITDIKRRDLILVHAS